LIIDCCLTSSEQYFCYVHDENKFINEGETGQLAQRLVTRLVTITGKLWIVGHGYGQK